MTSLPAVTTDDERLIAMWLHGRPATTQRVYSHTAAEFIRHLRKLLHQVTLADIQAYQAQVEYHSPSTVSKKLSAVKSLFTFAHKTGYVQFNPGVALQMPRVKNGLAERILSEDDVRRMIELETNKRNRTILRLLYMGGLRRQELCSLRVKDMRKHGPGGKLTVFGKGGKTRIIPLPASMWDELSEIAPEDKEMPLFSTKRGPISDATVWRIVKNAAKRAGLPPGVSVHWLRHSHSSHALDHGCPIHVLQSVLGHSNIATTSKYLHVNSTDSSADYLSDLK